MPQTSHQAKQAFKVTAAGQDNGGDFCADFRLSAVQAAAFFSRAQDVTTSEIHEKADELPCWVRGIADSENGLAQWEIRAGGTATMTLSDGTARTLLCTNCDDLLGG